MAWIEFNNNPIGKKVGDCSVRAVSKALGMGWEAAYIALVISGMQLGDMPSSNSVWGSVLRMHGYTRKSLPDTCPDCYTAADFCEDHPEGTYVLGFDGHVATVEDGNIYDSWDSSMEIPQFVWYRKGSDLNGL